MAPQACVSFLACSLSETFSCFQVAASYCSSRERVCGEGLQGEAESLGEHMIQHSSQPSEKRILTVPALIKCGVLPGNLRVVGLFSTFFTKKASISSWVTTQSGMGERFGSASQLSALFSMPLPAF